MKRTKIVATVGPATDEPGLLRSMIDAGLDVVRMNFSHGTYADWDARIERLREEIHTSANHIPLLLDTKGPEIRTGYVEGFDTDQTAKLLLERGSRVTFICRDGSATPEGPRSTKSEIYLSYGKLAQLVKPGGLILIDDGAISTRIISAEGERIEAEVLNNGLIGSRKGVNAPGVTLEFPHLIDKDREDILYGISKDIDYVAVSFVRTAEDVLAVRRLLNLNAGENVKIIAKIENAQGVANIDEILTIADGIMVARGDLGVEIPFDQVPTVQDTLIEKSVSVGKIVITATHMLNSMIEHPLPTRAEVSDVYNAVKESTTCVMLSGETAFGRYPLEAVQTMTRIITSAESNTSPHVPVAIEGHVSPAVTSTGVALARLTNSTAIIVYTESGSTARYTSAFRPRVPILAITKDPRVARQMNALWGVVPVLDTKERNFEAMFSDGVTIAKERLSLEEGDTVIALAGTHVGISGSTNTIRILSIGETIAHGRCMNAGTVTGTVRICETFTQAQEIVGEGDIAVVFNFTSDYKELCSRMGGLIIAGSNYDQGAIEHARSCGKPILVDVHGIEQKFTDGQRVRLIAHKGAVLAQD